MTVYYDPQQSLFEGVIQWRDSSVKWVLFRPEFWLYVVIHVVLVTLSIVADVQLIDVNVEAAFAVQYFTTFFLTFYNAHCFARYEELYPHTMNVLDGVLLMVHEMTITLKDPSLRQHRLQATKYILAAAYVFFIGITNESEALEKRAWEEIIRKGLLVKKEAEILRRYMGPEVVPVLMTWSMYVVSDALEQDCMHTARSERIAHAHNRFNKYQLSIMESYHKITHMMAMPIPYTYWHLMNLIFLINFMIVSVTFASYRRWLSIVPYTFALLVFMGLREVSNALANPFGEDSVDFPLSKYLDYTFDYAVCLVDAFSHPNAYMQVKYAIKHAVPFNEQQLRRPAQKDILYTEGFKAHVEGTFLWNREMPLQRIGDPDRNPGVEEDGVGGMLRDAFGNIEERRPEFSDADPEWQRRRNQELMRQLARMEAELETYRQGGLPVGAMASINMMGASQPTGSMQRGGMFGGFSQSIAGFASSTGFAGKGDRRQRHLQLNRWASGSAAVRSSGSGAASRFMRFTGMGRMMSGRSEEEGHRPDRAFHMENINFNNFDDARQRIRRAMNDALDEFTLSSSVGSGTFGSEGRLATPVGYSIGTLSQFPTGPLPRPVQAGVYDHHI
mmetsp:Transcript_54186/g.129063  ORF Transcript_54186/g.129063 Transcript_54186/m.129063 type:complete len:615 (-) Transcript_54186:187-2031(-)